MKNYILLYVLLTCYLVNAQIPTLLYDVNPTGSSDVSSASGKSIIEFNGELYFTANNGVNGSELWKYDGSSTELFLDINPGEAGSDCDNFFVLNNKLIFTANDGVHGIEWWVSDGTPGNTKLLKDIFTGSANGVFFSSFSSLENFTIFNNKVFFTGINREDDYELWVTDGTEAGTTIVKNILSDFSSFNRGSFPQDYAILNNELLFSCRDGLWKTDGTETGTVEVNPDLEPSDLVLLNNKVIFWNNNSIWVTDGTNMGTEEIKSLERPITNNSNELAFSVIGNKAFFAGKDTSSGSELWITDGTSIGTKLVLDATPGAEGYTPQNKVVFKNKLYYKGNDGQNGIEFWVSDGTTQGTYMLKDISPGSSDGFYLPTEIYATDKYMYMSAGSSFNTNLWVSDGTESGTVELVITDDEMKPKRFFFFDNAVFFFAFNSNNIEREPHFISEDAFSINKINLDYDRAYYPNPTSDVIFINNSNKSITSIQIADINGKLVDNFTNIYDSTIKLSFFNKAKGVYFVTCTTAFSKVTKKVIKK